MRLDYAPVIDVRSAKPKSTTGSSGIDASRDAAVEAAKYASKATQLLELGEALTDFHFQTQSVRYYAVSKDLREYIKAGDVNIAELMDESNPDASGDVPLIKATAHWFEDTQEYLFSHID